MYNAVITRLSLSRRGTTVTEDEFKALLAVEGRRMMVTRVSEESPYYIAVIANNHTFQGVLYVAGKTYSATVKEIIKKYYADN